LTYYPHFKRGMELMVTIDLEMVSLSISNPYS
jgi:hypothetical protein